jgi:primosomal protein N' (replication factor Y)
MTVSVEQPELFAPPPPVPETGGFVRVALDAPVFRGFDYHFPESLGGHFFPGQRVLVPVGKGDRKTVGFVTQRLDRSRIRPGMRIKSVAAVLDHKPLMTPTVYRLACKMAEYYCCPLGTALAAVVPAAVKKRAGERKVRLAALPAQPSLAPKLSAKQQAVMGRLAEAGRPIKVDELAAAAGCTPALVRKLADLKLLEIREVRAWDLDESLQPPPGPRRPKINPDAVARRLELTGEQARALEVVSSRLDLPEFGVVLLYGVTGSGKTEVYLRAIERVVAAGRQAIVLVPEISLTPQTRARFEERFGHVAVLHSQMSDTARHQEWRRIATGQADVVVGARSAVFAPTPRLGLIVVDEEHEGSYKQSDAQPRYHARDVGILRARMEGCPVLLGSATPSLETLHNCATRPHFARVDLTARVDSLPMPPVSVVDMRAEARRRPGHHILSLELETELREAFARGEQAILLLNRRGHSTFLLCPPCGYVARCPHCDVALVFHQTSRLGRCHYCGQTQPPPTLCPACNRGEVRRFGAGTQRLEEELARVFPDVPMARMDSDTTAAAGAHDEILKAFERGDLKLLFGTQMIAKGLHFPRVTVVGVVNADTALAIPDFRAGERTFQMISQVAGRAGRSHLGGRVVVQSFEPQVPPITQAAAHDYLGFSAGELPQRRALDYPPFARLVSFVVRDEQRDKAEAAAKSLAAELSAIAAAKALAVRFRGPVPAPIGKLADHYRFLLLASADGPEPLQAMLAEARRSRCLESADIAVDVDPMTVM